MASEGAIIPQLVESITQSTSPSAAHCSVPMAGGDISNSAHTTIPCQTEEIILDEKTQNELFTDSFCRVCGAILQFESQRNAHYESKKHAQKVRLYFSNKELEEIAYKKKLENKMDRLGSRANKTFSSDKNKFCSLCNMVFSSPVVAQSHYVGKIHAKKLRQMSGEQSEWSIEDDSSVIPPADTAPSHVSVPPLTENSSQEEVSAEKPPPNSAANNEIDLSDPNKYCKLCSASFNKPLVAEQHYKGKKHVRNEARQRMLEDLQAPIDTEAVGVRTYGCPVCKITFTSVEMYQSHMQGNKHQIKENMVPTLMKTRNKTYDSFQDELADYIKVQKARGLEPKMQFRQGKDHHDSSDDMDLQPAPVQPHMNPSAPYKYFGHPPTPYPAYTSLHPADPRTAAWEKPYRPQKPTLRNSSKTVPHRKHSPSSSDPSDYTSSDDSVGSYKKKRRHKREHKSKESKQRNKSRTQKGSSDRKKRKNEEGDSGKEESEKEKAADLTLGDKSKHRREKRKREVQTTDKVNKKQKKTKKPEDQKTEEELLWDESILGF